MTVLLLHVTRCVRGHVGKEGTALSPAVISREMVIVTLVARVSTAQSSWALQCQFPKHPPTSCTWVKSISRLQAGGTAVTSSCDVPGAVEVFNWWNPGCKTPLPSVWKADSWTACNAPLCKALQTAPTKCRVLGYHHLAGPRRTHRVRITKFSRLTWLLVLKKERKIVSRTDKMYTTGKKSYRRQNINHSSKMRESLLLKGF